MLRRDIWTILLTTLVTILIWVWAAGETRDNKEINTIVRFTTPDPANWVIAPEQQSVTVTVNGSQLALQQATTALRRHISISVPAQAGRQTIDLLDRLRAHDQIRGAGVSVLSAEPGLVEVELDPIERITVPVKPVLPGISFEGDVQKKPSEVTVAMPSQLRQRIGPNFAVEAAIDKADLDRLTPGVQQTQDVKLRLPEGFGPSDNVTISPSRSKITFTIRSRTRETKLDSVRVQLAGPPEDREIYDVEIDPKQLNNVTISADADLIRRIEANEVPVVAVVHVGSREKEARIDSKRVTYFLALVPEPGGGTRGQQVTGKVGDSNEMPLIKLNITERVRQ